MGGLESGHFIDSVILEKDVSMHVIIPTLDCRPIILRDKITSKIVYDLELYNYTFVCPYASQKIVWHPH